MGDHNRAIHGPEWQAYQKLVVEDDITNNFAEAAEAEEAVVAVTKVTGEEVAAGSDIAIKETALVPGRTNKWLSKMGRKFGSRT